MGGDPAERPHAVPEAGRWPFRRALLYGLSLGMLALAAVTVVLGGLLGGTVLLMISVAASALAALLLLLALR